MARPASCSQGLATDSGRCRYKLQWTKQGVIFTPDNNYEWMVSHASIPIAERYGQTLRVYFGTRDSQGRSLPAYVELDADNPRQVVRVNDQPLLMLGELGSFDDSGIMPSWIVEHGGRKYLYYIGWNPQVTVSYRLSIGLAISEDGGETFTKYSIGPICDRATEEPFFNTAPCVIIENAIWRMWYISCTGWKIIAGRPEPAYHVKYAESSDGVHWDRTGHICIDYDDFTQAIGRPCVYQEDNLYKMLYSYRGVDGYRTDANQAYRLGYAESRDGLYWTRKDSDVGIALSSEGWDSQMMEYCSIYRDDEHTYLFYNGNGFGKSGFGYAIPTKTDIGV